MPSPTSSTRPTSRASSFERYCSISVCSTETISSALNLMTASQQDVVADGFELGADRAVILPIADANEQAKLIEDHVAVSRLLGRIEQSLRVDAGHALGGHVGGRSQIFSVVVVHRLWRGLDDSSPGRYTNVSELSSYTVRLKQNASR